MTVGAKTNTLQYDPQKCTNCRMCTAVCPHGVFAPGETKAELVAPEECMECGACALNCPTQAITVESGVGCAYALMRQALTGRKEDGCCGPGGDCCT
jgi:NAD-dependent dihydropyrimidine dehydrogenase PreA subunit